MKKYTNGYGCVMEFDESIPQEEVNKRLSWLGKNWREVKEDEV